MLFSIDSDSQSPLAAEKRNYIVTEKKMGGRKVPVWKSP